MTNLEELETTDPETGQVNAIIESPKGSRNKFNYEPDRGLFRRGKVLPAGSVFPFDMGFLPSTRGEDGDPLDVLVLMDEPVFPICLVEARLIGVIEAEQTERDGQTMRNEPSPPSSSSSCPTTRWPSRSSSRPGAAARTGPGRCWRTGSGGMRGSSGACSGVAGDRHFWVKNRPPPRPMCCLV